MHVYYTDPQLPFMSAWSQSWSHFFVLLPLKKSFCISPWSNILVKLMEVWYFSEIQEYNFLKLVGLTVNIME